MCHILELAQKYKRLLVLVPRDHYKSTLGTISYPTWRALNNPNDTGLIVANTATNAQRFGARVRAAFEKQPLVRQLYPKLRPELSNRWNKEEMCLPREQDHAEATWTFIGWTTKITSQHFDYIIYDDLVDEETYESPELMAKLIDRFEQREGLLKPPIHERTVIVIMNHWSTIDLACHILEKHPEYHVYYRQAIEGGKPIFPEMYTLSWLLRKQEINPFTFANQFMNNPCDESLAENKAEWLQKYKRLENGLMLSKEYDEEIVRYGHLNIFAAVDPRHSLATTAAQKLTSRNAILVGGIDSKGRRFALDEYAARSSPNELVHKMLEIHKKWHPIEMGIESYGYQAALEPLSREIWKDEEDTPNLTLLPRDTRTSKEVRIRGGFQFFRQGKGFSHRFLPAFNEEYLTFSACKTRDLADCWAWLMFMMQPPASDDDWAAEAAADKDYERSLTRGI